MKPLYSIAKIFSFCISSIYFSDSGAQVCMPETSYTFIFGYQSNQKDTAEMFLYTYNRFNHLSSETKLTKDPQTHKFSNFSKRNYHYNSAGLLALEQYSNWNSNSNSWEPKFISKYSYNNENLLMEVIGTRFDFYTKIWVNNSKAVYTYTPENKIKEMNFYLWIDNQWSINSKSVYTYSGSDSDYTFEYYSWNIKDKILEKSQKKEYKYNSDQTLASEIEYRGLGAVWNLEYQTKYAYNSDQTKSAIITEKWNPQRQFWDLNSMIQITYDKPNNSESHINYYYDGKDWISFSLKKYDYDSNNCLMVYDYKEGYNIKDGSYYYRQQSTYTNQFSPREDTELKIYPNPANQFLTFQIEGIKSTSVRFYDASGQPIECTASEIYEDHIVFDVSVLSSGIYMVLVGDKKFKFMKN